MQPTSGVLLVNLGTPKSPQPKDVYRYLIEFLTDERVMDLPWLQRQLLVRGLIVPKRYRQSAQFYKEIWTAEGSPLMVYGKRVKTLLQEALGENYFVELAMRYQEPSIVDGLKSILSKGVGHLIVLPLFPQYASATTGSVHQRVQEELCKLNVMPKVTLINHFATDTGLIDAFCASARQFELKDYDHILFSFHGLPQRQLKKANPNCFSQNCCQDVKNECCYLAQCHATTHAIVKKLDLPKNSFTICFQSRLGKDPWIEPYASNTIENLAKQGKKNVLVMCPAFVCDCLETIYEIGVEYDHLFKQAGGHRLTLVPGLNDRPEWIAALKEIVLNT